VNLNELAWDRIYPCVSWEHECFKQLSIYRPFKEGTARGHTRQSHVDPVYRKQAPNRGFHPSARPRLERRRRSRRHGAEIPTVRSKTWTASCPLPAKNGARSLAPRRILPPPRAQRGTLTAAREETTATALTPPLLHFRFAVVSTL
jgi:hypothetical protein